MSGVFVKENNLLTKVADDSTTDIATLTSRISSIENELEYLNDSNMKAIYIDNVNGDDTNDGLSQASPIKTFPTMDFLNKLGTCNYFQYYFMSDYTGNVTVPRKGNLVLLGSVDANNRITITGQVNITYIPSVIIQNLNLTYATANNTLIVQHGDLLVKDCDITNTSGSGSSARTAISLEQISCGEIRACNVTARRCISVSWSNIYIRNTSGKTSVWTATLDYIAQSVAGIIFTDDYYPVTFNYPTGFLSRTNQYGSGVWFKHGKLQYQDFVSKTELPAVTVYIDYANGSDTNDGSTSALAMKTVDAVFIKYKYSRKLTLSFVSDYTGNITYNGADDGNVSVISFTSADTSNPSKITGSIYLTNLLYVSFNGIKTSFECTNDIEYSVRLATIPRVYLTNCEIECVDNNRAGYGIGLRLDGCNSVFLYDGVSIKCTGTYAGRCGVRAYSSTIAIATSTSTGFAALIQILNGSLAMLTGGFISNSTYTGSDAVLFGGSTCNACFVDNKLINQPIPECPTTTDGTFVLKATVSSGAVTYSWVAE